MANKRFIAIFIGLILPFFLITPSFAYFIKNSNNPVLPIGTSGLWDDNSVTNAKVMFDDNLYKIWYYGNHTDLNGSFGYATSTDGINWTKLDNPIFSKDSSDSSELEVNGPRVYKFGNVYKMWYSSVAANPIPGSEVYRVKYATSPNGINSWTKYGIVFRRSGQAWDEEGVVPSTILFINGEYRMWYGARDRNGHWSIGYAHSNNESSGWIPNLNPIMSPTSDDGFSVGVSTVIYDNISGNYHMYFHTGSLTLDNNNQPTNGPPNKIWHAVSPNGITAWTKDANPIFISNPLIVNGVNFDDKLIASPEVIKIDNTYLMYYCGHNGHNWQIGLATDGPFPIPSPTLSPTPTPTPSPSPTPTPTPTPSPTPSLIPSPTPLPTPSPTPETKKVILVPGLAASWNTDAIMNCKSGNYSGSWNIIPVIGAQIYQPIIDALTNANYTVVPYYYDWRLPIDAQGEHLEEFINQNTSANEKVNIIGHSMGGLVGRAYLEHTKQQNKIDKMLTIGSPHQGTPQAYYAWAGGEIVGEMNWRIYGSFVKFMCSKNNLLANPRQIVQQYIPSTQNLLPIFEYLRYQNSQEYKSLVFMKNLNNWLPTHQFPPFYGAGVATLAGTGQQTMNDIVVRNPTLFETRQGNWLDGKPIKDEYVSDGDGTVLLKSSEMEADKNFRLSLNHSQIINDPLAILMIVNYLQGINQSAVAFNLTENSISSDKPALAIITTKAITKVTKPDGSVVKDQNGIIILSDTETGDYSFKMQPLSWNSKVYIGQFLKSGEIKWQEFGFSNPLPKTRTLKYNPSQITKNILQ